MSQTRMGLFISRTVSVAALLVLLVGVCASASFTRIWARLSIWARSVRPGALPGTSKTLSLTASCRNTATIWWCQTRRRPSWRCLARLTGAGPLRKRCDKNETRSPAQRPVSVTPFFPST